MTETFLQMAERHHAADGMLAKGRFEWSGSSACSVGCFNHDLGNEPADFEALSRFSGYPEWAHHIQETLFECLPEPDNRDWHVQFAKACEAITDWDAAYHQMMIAILMVALPHDTSQEQVVQAVIDLHGRGKEVSSREWAAAGTAAFITMRDAFLSLPDNT